MRYGFTVPVALTVFHNACAFGRIALHGTGGIYSDLCGG